MNVETKPGMAFVRRLLAAVVLRFNLNRRKVGQNVAYRRQ
jgi:hypothetical protein